MSSDMMNRIIDEVNALKAHGLDSAVNEPDFGEVKRLFNAFKREFYMLELETLTYKEIQYLYNAINHISNRLFEEHMRRQLKKVEEGESVLK